MPFEKKSPVAVAEKPHPLAEGTVPEAALHSKSSHKPTVCVGQPGIVYFAPTNRGGTPVAAIVTRVGGEGSRTLSLMVFSPGGSIQNVGGVCHHKDPSFDLNPERDLNVGSWAYYDEL